MRVNEKTSKTVRLVYGCTFGVYTVILAALILWQVLSIYNTGIQCADGVIYSREIAGESISLLSPALILWLVLAAVGFVLWEIFTVKEKLPKLDVRYTLHILKKRAPSKLPASADKELKKSYKFVWQQQESTVVMWMCCACIGFACAIYAIVYLANSANFPKVNVTQEMKNMAVNVLIGAVFTLAVACVIAVFEGKSAKEQQEHLKKLIAAGKKDDEIGKAPKGFPSVFDGIREKFAEFYQRLQMKAENNKFCAALLWICKHHVLAVRTAVLAIAAVFIIVGVVNGSARDMLTKAINICTECIGLG